MSGSFEARPSDEETYSVSRLCGEIRELVSHAFPEFWVVGELQRLKSSRAGHLYFELIEKGDDDRIVGKLDVAVWRTYNRQVQARLSRAGATLAEGQQIRCRGRVDFYEQGGRLQLIVTDIDPTFTLGRLELRRRETIEALRSGGLLDLNKGYELPSVPLDVALITSDESAAYHDFLSSLAESPYGFRVTFIHAAVQGAAAETQLVSALRAAGRLKVDCIALVRGGGSRTDLAVFDSRLVAEAVAKVPLPVVVGLGHETDQSVVDLVAHTSLKTPTGAAEYLLGQVEAAETRLERMGVGLRHHALGHVRRARERIGSAERSIDLAQVRVAAARDRWRYVARGLGHAASALLASARGERRAVLGRLEEAAPRYLARRSRLPERLFERLPPAVERRIAAASTRLQGYERLCVGLAPERTLRRGFSITRDSEGEVLRDADQAAPGTRLSTQLAEGVIASRVEEK